MVAIRKSFEKGHRRKFLVIVDQTPECDRAIIYASKRAQRTGGLVTLLYVIEPGDFDQWLLVKEKREEEEKEEAGLLLAQASETVKRFAQLVPEKIIRVGNRSEQILELIEEDTDIAILVLAAGTDNEGPGPLVASFLGKDAGVFPLPITLVPGTLTDEDIGSLA